MKSSRIESSSSSVNKGEFIPPRSLSKLKAIVRMLPDKILKRKLAKKEKQKLKVLADNRKAKDQEDDPPADAADSEQETEKMIKKKRKLTSGADQGKQENGKAKKSK